MAVSKHPDISKQNQSHKLQHLKAHDCSAKLCPQTYLPCIVSNTQNIMGWWWQALFWRDDTVIDGALRVLFPPSCSLLKHVGLLTEVLECPNPLRQQHWSSFLFSKQYFVTVEPKGFRLMILIFFCSKYKIFFFIGVKMWIQQRKETAAAMPGS